VATDVRGTLGRPTTSFCIDAHYRLAEVAAAISTTRLVTNCTTDKKLNLIILVVRSKQ